MSNNRSMAPLVLGLMLVVLGGLFLAVNVVHFDVRWFHLLRFAIPVVLLLIGVTKLVRHFLWDDVRLRENPGKASLLAGIFWTAVGAIALLDLLGVLYFLPFFGAYWPGILILFGLGKIFDFYRLSGGLQFRAAEIVGVVFMILLGLVASATSRRLAEFDPEIQTLSYSHWPIVFTGEEFERKIRVESREELAAAGVQTIQTDNQYGDVEIESGLEDKVEVGLTVVSSGESEKRADEIARQVQLSVQKEGGLIKVSTNRASFKDPAYRMSTHLRLLVPARLEVKVNNENGRVRVTGIKAPVSVDSSYGDVTLESITGNVQAKNRYESITVSNVEGDVITENRRGHTRVQDIRGNVRAATDYDSIEAERISGKLEVANHFGDVRVRAVQGPVSIKSPGSGVNVADVEKAVYIENSHKDVRVSEVEESVELDTSYSQVQLSQVTGGVTIRASHSDLGLRDIKKGVSVQGSGSKVSLSGVDGPVKIATSLQRVFIDGFQGPAEIQNEYGEIVMKPNAPLNGALVASNRNGEITLTLPDDVNCRLSAQAPGGEVVSEFGAKGAEREKSQMFEQTIGGGKNEVRLQTTYSRIRITKSD